MKLTIPAQEKVRFKAWLMRQSAENKAQCRQLIVRSTEMFVKYAKISAPSDNGFLRNSIHPSYSSDGLGSTTVVGVNYAPYQEFGTGRYVHVLSGYEDYAMMFKGRGIRKVNMHAQPYFFHNFERINKSFINELKRMGFNDEGPLG